MDLFRFLWWSKLVGTICIFILISINYNVFGQEGYNKTIDIGRSVWLKKIKYNENIGITMSGVYYNDSSNWQNIILIYADTTGHVIKTIEIADPLNQSHLTASDESGFVLNPGSRSVVPFSFYNRSTLGLAFIDSSSELEAVKEYAFDSGSIIIPYDILEYQNGYLITGAYQKPPSLSIKAFVLNTDKVGNKNWMKEYGSSTYNEFSRTITFINSNYYVVSATKFSLSGEDYSVGWMTAIDSLGNVKWEWSADTNEITSNGIFSLEYDYLNSQFKYFTFLKRTTTYPGKNYEVSIPVFVARDTSMNLLYYKEYGPYAIGNYIRNLEPSVDGWIAVGGTTTTTDDYVSPIVSDFGQIVKLSNDGTLIWQVVDTAFFHPIIGSRSYLSGLTESPSGSIYAVGWANNYDQNEVYRAFGWLLKISPDGCVDTICTTNSILDQIRPPDRNIRIYPNPASDYIHVESNYPEYQTCYFEVYDLNGARCIHRILASSKDLISLDGINNGLHVWKATDRNGFVIDQGKLMVIKYE